MVEDSDTYRALIDTLKENDMTFKVEEIKDLEDFKKIHIKAATDELFWIGISVGIKIAP